MTLIPKGEKHTTPFFGKYFVNDDLPYRTQCSAQFFPFKNISSMAKYLLSGKCRSAFAFEYHIVS